MICPLLYVSMEVHMKRTELRQEMRKMKFEEVYEGWRQRCLTQGKAA
jgi:hypothetical protein